MAKHPAKCPRCGNRLEFDTAVDEKLVCSGCQVLLTFPGKIKPSDRVDPLIGQTLGQYEITDLLGRGGMGAVYKARQPSLGRFVAVKVLPKALLREASFLDRFIREARDAASVNHPNIIQIYDVGQDKGFQYIAMECVEGESLADLLKREGPLPADRALDLMKQVVAALVKAHAAGIVHRDIKPSNILLTTDGHAKVADFGLAKRTGTDVSVTHTGQAMGTPLYWPPEVARGGRADARADLYSLGATFYHLLGGRPPFEGGNAVELAIKHTNDLPTPLEDLAPDTPLPLSRIIHRLLAKNPADRLQTAAELQDALGRLSLVVPPSGGLSSLRSSASQRRPGGSAGRSQAELGNEEVSPAGAEARIPRPPGGFRARGRVDGSADPSYPPAGAEARGREAAEARGREAAEARGREGADGEPTVRMPSALRPSLDRATAGLPSRADRGESGAPAVQQGAATGTLPGAAHVPLAERRHVKTRQRRKLFLFGGLAAVASIVLVLVLVLVLGSSSSRSQATTPPPSSPGTPPPTPHPPTPPSPPPTPKTEHRQPKTASPASPAPAAGPPWESAWKEADAKAKALTKEQRFGDAAKVYSALAEVFDDLRLKDRAQKAVAAVHEQADAAYAEIETAAKKLTAEKKLDDARAALRPVLDRFGLPLKAEAAKKLLAEIETAEKIEGTAKVAKDAKKEDEKGKEIDKAELERREGEAKKRQEAEAAFAKAMEPVETLVAAWDFSAAADSLPKVPMPSLPKVSIPSGGYSEDFARRLSTRRDELARLAALKAKFIAKVNGKKPPYRKGSLFIPGANADLTKADDQGITAVPPDGKPELVPWPSLSSRSVQALILQSVDRQSADDWLAGGILLLALKDASAAEKHFDKAKELGAAIERYLDPLAAGAFAQAQALLEAKRPAEAGSALAALEKKYAATPWLAVHKPDLASARDAAKAGIAASEAEKLYADAAKLFEKKELFDLKPLIEKLKTDYPKTRPVTDAQGKPSFAEMLRATEDLGRFITVRQDGKADFKTIQGALSAAPSNSVIEIQDKGPYNEHLVFPARQGLTLRGKKGLWPLIISAGENRNFVSLVEAKARDAALGRLVIAAYQAVPDGGAVSGGSLRSVILVSAGRATYSGSGADVQDSFLTNSSLVGRVKNTIFAGGGWPVGAVELENCVISGGLGDPGNSTKLRSCIVGGFLQVSGGSDLADSILCGGVSTPEPNTRIEYCDVMGTLVNFAKPGKHCFSADPQFRDPANFDYRLKPTSPCRKKASDGGDLGVRYTPEMVEVLEKALELRKKGIIKF